MLWYKNVSNHCIQLDNCAGFARPGEEFCVDEHGDEGMMRSLSLLIAKRYVIYCPAVKGKTVKTWVLGIDSEDLVSEEEDLKNLVSAKSVVVKPKPSAKKAAANPDRWDFI
jgi:hypothetical protein